MTHEELLTKYLDDSLNETERAEFNKLLNTSPEFSRDVRELSKIEELLKEGPVVASVVPVAFLDSVENHIAGRIHHEKYHISGSANTFTKLLSGMWILPVMLLVGVGSFYMLRDSTPESRVQTPVEAPQEQQTIPTQPEILPAPENVPQPVPAPKADVKPPQETVDQEITRKPDEIRANIENPQTNSDKTALEATREKLAAARAGGKKATEAALLKQMGILAFKTGNPSEAKIYLNNAAALAGDLHLNQLQAESIGELGLIFKKEGNSAAAAENFKKAIDLLKAAGQNSERWDKELN